MILQQICNHCKLVLHEYEGDTLDCANKVHYCKDCINNPNILDDFMGRKITEDEKLKWLCSSLSEEEKVVLNCFV